MTNSDFDNQTTQDDETTTVSEPEAVSTPPTPDNNDDNDVIMIPRTAFNYVIVAVVFFVLGGLMGSFVLPSNSGEEAALPANFETVLQETMTEVLRESGVIQDPGPTAGERYEVAAHANAPVKGNPDAAVTMVEFGDFLCGFCGRFAEDTLPTLLEEYGDDVRFVYMNYPVIDPQGSRLIASAAACAHEQDAFWEYHDGLYENQQNINNDLLYTLAEDVGLDIEAFSTCYDNGEKLDAIEEDFEYGRELGIRGTPAFFINGRFVNGAQDVSVFRDILDEELARAQGDEATS